MQRFSVSFYRLNRSAGKIAFSATFHFRFPFLLGPYGSPPQCSANATAITVRATVQSVVMSRPDAIRLRKCERYKANGMKWIQYLIELIGQFQRIGTCTAVLAAAADEYQQDKLLIMSSKKLTSIPVSGMHRQGTHYFSVLPMYSGWKPVIMTHRII